MIDAGYKKIVVLCKDMINRHMYYVLKNRTSWHIHNYLCKLSRSRFNKLEAIQARHHMKDATNMTVPS